LIKTGKTYALGITIDSKTPAFPPRGLSLQVVQPGQQEGKRPFPNNLVYNDDIFQGWFGIGPQLDGLGHVGWEGIYFNCNKAQDFANITGLSKMGIEQVPPLVARGVLLDMAGHFGVKHMEAGKFFTAEDIKAAAQKQGVELRQGDVILFHTGWTENVLPTDPQKWVSGEPGMSEDAAEYLASIGPVAVGADTWGVDVVPPHKEARPFQGHIILIQQEGIYLLETMNTGPLVQDKAWEFLFVLGQAKIRGAVQMIINPVAIR
jgi:kynurenine formamidase